MADGVVHIVGMDVIVHGCHRRQRCSWCGQMLLDDDLSRMSWALNEDGSDPGPPGGWPMGELVEIVGDSKPEPGEALGFRGMRVIEVEDGKLPDNACAMLDPDVTL